MSRTKPVFTLLVLAGAMMWSVQALAQTQSPPSRTPAPAVQQAAPATPQVPPAVAPAAPASSAAAEQPQQADQAADPIGSVATLTGSASVTHANATSALKLSQSIYKGDVLQTGTDGSMGITFDDDTTFTLKPNSRMAVDDFVYQKGGPNNAATLNILLGTVAFVAAEVAHSGNMKIETPTSTLGIRGTTGVVEVPAAGAANATNGVSIKLYPDADGKVGRIEVFGRDGSQLGVLNRGATGFAVRAGAPGAPQRFTAAPLQISAQEAERDRSFTRQAFSTQLVGRQINIQRRIQQRNQQLRQNQQRPNQPQQRNELRPGQQRNELRPGQQRPNPQQRRNELRPGQQPLNLQQQRNAARPGQQAPSHQLPSPQRAGQLPGSAPQPGVSRPLATPGTAPRTLGVTPAATPRAPPVIRANPALLRPATRMPKLPAAPRSRAPREPRERNKR